MAKPSQPAAGKAARSAVVGAAAARVAAKRALAQGTRPFLPAAAREDAERAHDEDAARILFDALCTLRGTALKAAQLLAMEAELLPEAYRIQLARSCSEVRPMNRALVLTTVRRELGRTDSAFASFDPEPFAAASLGQVHAATARDGRRLAVKIQYPGMDEATKADLALLKALLTPTRYRTIFASCFPIVAGKLEEELDYRREADQTEFFGARLPADRFVVPAVERGSSTGQVLTTERLDGLHLDRWLKTNPSRAARNHFGQLLVDLFHRGLSLGVLHADPNPGNFLFREDGRLGIVDFGCIDRLTPALTQTAFALLAPDRPLRETVERQLRGESGIHYRRDIDVPALEGFLLEWGAWLREPYSGDGYDFAAHPDYFARALPLARRFYEHLHHYDGEFIYFGRTIHGLLRMLGQLGAAVRMQPTGAPESKEA